MTTEHICRTIHHAGATVARWGLGLGLAVLGVSFALLTRPVQAQTDVPEDPATQAVWAYLAAHGVSLKNAEPVPDAATQGVLGYLRAHGMGQAPVTRGADANTLGVLGYVRAHESVPTSMPVTLPDAATQGVLGYLRAHSLVVAPEGNRVATAMVEGPKVDWVSALALTVLLGGLVTGFVLLAAHKRPDHGDRPAHQHR